MDFSLIGKPPAPGVDLRTPTFQLSWLRNCWWKSWDIISSSCSQCPELDGRKAGTSLLAVLAWGQPFCRQSGSWMPGRPPIVTVVIRDCASRFNLHCFSFFPEKCFDYFNLSFQILEWRRTAVSHSVLFSNSGDGCEPVSSFVCEGALLSLALVAVFYLQIFF